MKDVIVNALGFTWTREASPVGKIHAFAVFLDIAPYLLLAHNILFNPGLNMETAAALVLFGLKVAVGNNTAEDSASKP